jgi:hypothetical protein
MPLHRDNQSIIKERVYVDKTNPDILHDEITTIDHAVTRPWTVTKNYRRDHNPVWFQMNCSEDNHHVMIGGEEYYISGEDLLMPAKKDQQPPDLRFFKPAPK